MCVPKNKFVMSSSNFDQERIRKNSRTVLLYKTESYVRLKITNLTFMADIDSFSHYKKTNMVA